MKTVITITAAVFVAMLIVLFVVISWRFDNWFIGVITGISLTAYPSWVKETFEKNKNK